MSYSSHELDIILRASAAVQALPFEADDATIVVAVLNAALDPRNETQVDYVARRLCDAHGSWESAEWLWGAAEHPQADSRYEAYIEEYRQQARAAISALSLRQNDKG